MALRLSSRRALFVSLLTLMGAAALPGPAAAAGVQPAQATPVQREQAQARFLRGRELAQAKRYDEAILEFRASLDIVASPNTRLSLARCLRALGRNVEAYVELGRTVVEAKELLADDSRYAKAGEAAAAERAELAPRLAFVTVTVLHATPETTLKVGSEQILPRAWSEAAPLAPGSGEIVASTPGRVPVRTTVRLRAGESAAVTLDVEAGAKLAAPVAQAPEPDAPPPAPEPEPDRPKPRPLRTAAWIAGGVGAAGLATFAVFGLMSGATYDGLARDCNNGPCPKERAGDVDAGRTQQTIANVGLVVGGAATAAAVTLFFVSAPKAKPPAAPSARLLVGPAWLGVQGTL